MVKVETKHIALAVKKEKQQTYNVTFIWDKTCNLNLKPNSKFNPNFFFFY
jgi:hypothetical protein